MLAPLSKARWRYAAAATASAAAAAVAVAVVAIAVASDPTRKVILKSGLCATRLSLHLHLQKTYSKYRGEYSAAFAFIFFMAHTLSPPFSVRKLSHTSYFGKLSLIHI